MDVFAVDGHHDRPELSPEDEASSPKRLRYGIKRPPRMEDLVHEQQLLGMQ